MGNIIDLTERKFGKLTVIERGKNSNDGHARWWCKCDCGNHELILVYGTKLINNKIKSCLCNHKYNTFLAHKKYNTYDLSGEYGIGYTSKGEEFYFDLDDYENIKDYCWYKNKHGYFVSKDINNKSKSIVFLHRIIMGISNKNIKIDHIYHKTYDNRKSELRIVNTSQNAMNHHLPENNTSGIVGVSYNKEQNKWRSRITVNGKSIYLGAYLNINDAIKVRKHAEKKYFGEYAYRTGEDKWQEKHRKN